jgi:quercetin dioxygenase-like cupin family protein
MKISNLDRIEKIKPNLEGAKEVYKQIPISKQDGSPNFSFRVFTIEPKGHTPFHKHPFEHLNYVIAGHGSLVEESGREHEVMGGDFVLILPDEKHQYKNRSMKDPFVIICAVPKEYE